ncbi:response regulator [bacterium]|nr:response regulator [bacterium]
MAIITIFSGSYCHGDKIAKNAAETLGYKLVDEEIFTETSRKYDVSVELLQRAVLDNLPPLKRIGNEREKLIGMLRTTLAEAGLQNNLVVNGYLGHLLPRTIAHLLKVCIIANFDYRVKQAEKFDNLPEKKASKIIHKDDKDRLQWTQFLFNQSPYDEDLYDITLPTSDHSIDEAVQLICQQAKSDAVKTTARAEEAARDFVLAARVRLALAQAGHDTETFAENGEVIVIINKYVVRLERYSEELKKIGSQVEGVRVIRTRTGQNYSAPSIMPMRDFELPSKILLVDDEREFVQTLSERLSTRNLDSSVVYDGEEALKFIASEEPDVMVLDLKMPGIDGIEVLRRVKREHPNVEVIILTGHGSEKEESLASDLGAFAYLQKPVDVDHLAQVMKAAYRKISDTQNE